MREHRIDELPRIRRALLAWHRRHGLRAPWRQSGDPYHALVAAVMAQQTQMSRVLPSYERFLAAFPTIDALAAASPGDVIRAWAGMGYNQRAVRLHRAARQIAATSWPHAAEDLARIDGIGPFTAAIIASFAFAVPAACVDTNVRRVLGRLAGDESIDDRRLQSLADAVMSRRAPARWNQALMDYGARVCTTRPRCDECVVAAHCASRKRFAAPPARVADERAPYDTKRTPKRRQPPFEESARYYRGRIVDVLRGLPPGATVPVGDLPRLIANGRAAPSPSATRELLEALERAGLAVIRDGAASLPE
jgi:A/G-specific adenine glycosylase